MTRAPNGLGTRHSMTTYADDFSRWTRGLELLFRENGE